MTDSADRAFLDVSLSDPTCFALTTELRKRGVQFIIHSGWGILARSSQDPNAGDFSPLTTLRRVSAPATPVRDRAHCASGWRKRELTKLEIKPLFAEGIGTGELVDRKKTDMLRLGIVDDDPAVSDALAPLFDIAGFKIHTFVSSDDHGMAAAASMLAGVAACPLLRISARH